MISNPDYDENTLTSVRLKLANMDGKLDQVIVSQALRIDAHTKEIGQLSSRINTIHTEVVANTVHLKELDKDVIEIKSNLTGAISKVMTVVAPILSVAALILIVLKDIYA